MIQLSDKGGFSMTRYCGECDKEYNCETKKCPECGKKLVKKYTPKELEEIQKQNDDFTVINTLLM